MPPSPAEDRARVGAVVFDGFELLDLTGPLELLGHLRDHYELCLVGPRAGAVASTQGVRVVADHSYADAPPCQVVLVPGGFGTRAITGDAALTSWLREWAGPAELVASVCTGSAVLAAAGLLDGYRATTNKAAFGWVAGHGPEVEWIPRARWVHDRDRWTSSGVAAGIDMTLALVAERHGMELAERLADVVEHDWHRDPHWDPFAARAGLVEDRPTPDAG